MGSPVTGHQLRQALTRSLQAQAADRHGGDCALEFNRALAEVACLQCGRPTSWHFGSDNRWIGHPGRDMEVSHGN